MKKLMTLLLTVAFGVAIVTPAYSQAAGPQGGKGQARQGQQGQRQGGGGMMRGQRMAQMEAKILDQIGVNADQKKKIADLNKDQQTKREALMKKYGITPPKPGERPGQGGQRPQFDPKMMEDMRAMQKGRQDSLKKILTKAQFAKYEELVKAERAKMRGGPGGPGGPGGGAGRPGGGGIKAGGGKPGI